ncbi:hypothetical protein [Streptomyces sp. NPDC096033]|uniref:hypothetical protein n=1 Tax=Streptomyces sp. NPDC096033 TaxID=3366071 RepID=UPI00380A98E3
MEVVDQIVTSPTTTTKNGMWDVPAHTSAGPLHVSAAGAPPSPAADRACLCL